VADDDGGRYEIAQGVFRQLEGMPLECLASNGESMRGKVFRVILALLNTTPEGALGDGLWDWWNMVSLRAFSELTAVLARAVYPADARGEWGSVGVVVVRDVCCIGWRGWTEDGQLTAWRRHGVHMAALDGRRGERRMR
jgi:hypothetical protein